MTTDAQPQAVRSYLAALKSALAGVPDDISREIVAGVSEELTGLDGEAAAIRIAELGDPAFIAAEARASNGPVVPAAQAPTPIAPAQVAPTPFRHTRGYVVLASLLVAFGGYVVPLVGWIVGIAMVWQSRVWRTWEKWVATIAPLSVLAIALLLVAVLPRVGGLTWWHLAIVFAILATVPAGLWLLWRALRRER